MMPASLVATEVDELVGLTELAPAQALRKAVPLLVRLLRDQAFLDECVYSLHEEAEGAEDWYVAHTREGEEGSCSLQVFVWPPESRTQAHDHTSWGVFRCVVGTILEERYERLDDGSRFEHARWRKAFSRLCNHLRRLSSLVMR